MRITFKRLTLAIASAGLLTIYGCGGGGGGVETADVDITVVDGPIKNATVCLDKNFNGACDPDEPSGKTDAAGKIKLKVAKADVNQYPVLAVVGTDAEDVDTGAVPVAFTLKAPADKSAVVSPLTTMVQTLLEGSGLSTAEAEAKVKADTGLNVSLFDDFTKGNSADQKAAQTIARLIVITTQQQTTALVSTLNTDALDGSKITKEKISKAVDKSILSRLPALKVAAADPAVTGAASPAAKEAALLGQANTLAAASELTPESLPTVVAVNNQASAPGAPPPTALEQAKAFLALFDASLANSFPGTGVSRAAFSDGCYLDDGTTKAVSITLFDQDRVLSGEQNKFRVGSTRTNVQVLAERDITNPDGSKRREIDVQYDVNYVDGTKFSDTDPAAFTTLISGSSSGSTFAPGIACTTPETGSNLRFFGNRAVVSASLRPWNERYERYNLATGMPLVSAVDYNKWVFFRITDNSNFAKYVIVKGPGLPAAGYKMVSPRIQRDAPEFAGKRGNFVNWLDTDSFRICRNSLNGGNGRDGALADCVGFGAQSNSLGVFNRPANLADSEFDVLGFVAGGSYTFAVHNDDGWKTVNGQASQTPIATYTRVLRRLPYSAVALAGAGPGSDLYPHITSSKTPVQLADIFRSKLADTTNLSWTALGTMPDGAKYGFGSAYSYEEGPANMNLNFWPRSRTFFAVYPANGALVAANFPIPAAAAVLVAPAYAEIGVDYANRTGGFVGSRVSFETVAP